MNNDEIYQIWRNEKGELDPTLNFGTVNITHRSVTGDRLWGKIDINKECNLDMTFSEAKDAIEKYFIDGCFLIKVIHTPELIAYAEGELDLHLSIIQKIVKEDESSFQKKYANFDK